MMWLKYLRLAWAFARALRIVWFSFPRWSRDEKSQAIQQWSRQVLHTLNIEVQAFTEEQQRPFDGPTLLVANHVSWLDVLVIQSINPCVFVAKLEVSCWPIIGTLARACGTIFVDRGSANAATEMVSGVTRALQQGDPVAAFPEGTSSEGLRVQVFHANLFESALKISALVQPIALRYCDPLTQELCTDVAFIGNGGFLASLHQVVQKPRLIAKVKLEKQLIPEGHSRRTLAHLSHRYVSAALDTLSLQPAA